MRPSKIQLYERIIHSRRFRRGHFYYNKSKNLHIRMAKKAKFTQNRNYFYMYNENGTRLKRYLVHRFI